MSGKFGFDAFLTNLPSMPSAEASVPPAQPVMTPAPQTIDIVMAELKKGPTTIRKMTPLFGNSLGTAIDTVDKLVTLGYVVRNGDEVNLTPAGTEAALTMV